MPFTFTPTPNKRSTTVRMWLHTRDKYNALANHFGLTLVEFMDSLATQLMESHDVKVPAEKIELDTK